MLSETEIANRVRHTLLQRRARVVQLVMPGGQAPYSITFEAEDRRITCYPDVIALIGSEILIGEMKPRFSNTDYRKLCAILGSEQARERTANIVRRHLDLDIAPVSYKGALFHSNPAAGSVKNVEQWIFTSAADEVLLRLSL